MKVVFPHMGNLYIGLKGLFERLDIDYADIPKPTKKSIEFGVRHSPEFVCFPFKANLGDFMQGINQGADTIIMVTDSGPCRLGIYGYIQDIILKKLGYDYRMIFFDYTNPLKFIRQFNQLDKNKSILQVIEAFIFGLHKLYLADLARKLFLKVKPYEKNKNQTNEVYKAMIDLIEKASFYKQLNSLKFLIKERFNEIPKKELNLPKVVIVGEIYMLLEDSLNFSLEDKLVELNIEVTRSVYFSDAILKAIKLKRDKKFSKANILKEALPYLRHNVGAECNISVGKSVIYAKEGYDGIFHVMPFTCTPETIAQSILTKVSRDFDIPILTLIIDENTQAVGLQTRLEAFSESLHFKKFKVRTH